MDSCNWCSSIHVGKHVKVSRSVTWNKNLVCLPKNCSHLFWGCRVFIAFQCVTLTHAPWERYSIQTPARNSNGSKPAIVTQFPCQLLNLMQACHGMWEAFVFLEKRLFSCYQKHMDKQSPSFCSMLLCLNGVLRRLQLACDMGTSLQMRHMLSMAERQGRKFWAAG